MGKAIAIGVIWILIFFGIAVFLSTLDGLIYEILMYLFSFFSVMSIYTLYKKLK